MGTSLDSISKECLNTFKSMAQIEADSLKTESYGIQLLQTIGYIYSLKAETCLTRLDYQEGHVFQKVWSFGNSWTGALKEKAHMVSETVGTARTIVDLHVSFNKLKDLEKKTQDGDSLTAAEEDQKQKLEYEAAQKGMEALWRVSKSEVENTLKAVCDRVLSGSQDKQILRRRAIALRALGEIYYNVKQ